MAEKIVALVPARSGSKRIPGKNTRDFAGLPLFLHSVYTAHALDLPVYVSSDDFETTKMAEEHGAFGIGCPTTIAHKDMDPDIFWVRHALMQIECDAFIIMRPTSPFRTPEMVKRAIDQFLANPMMDSLRAVERVKQTPYKMWKVEGALMSPLIWGRTDDAPYHDSPTQSHPPIYIQNASLEIAWRKTVMEKGTISGTRIMPFFTDGNEGFDINTSEDWMTAERLVDQLHGVVS